MTPIPLTIPKTDKNTKAGPRTLNIGLYGFGCIGQGLWGVLNETSGVSGNISRICVRQKDKSRPIPDKHFTLDGKELLEDSQLDVIVELIDRADDAWQIVRTALESGKSVVSANKKMIAEHFAELIEIQDRTGAALLYEGSSCGSIPIIRNLEEYYDNDSLSSLTAICNGTTNYILSRMYREGSDSDAVLADAQQLGFAESDPTLDIDGWDSKYKLLIMTGHAFGLFLKPEQILNIGIRQVGAQDLAFAKEKGLKIQLLARSYRSGDGKVVSYVLPSFIGAEHPFYNIKDEFNAVSVQAAFAEEQLFVGKGAGGYPTAAAVLSDLSALGYGYRYEYRKARQSDGIEAANEETLRVFCRYEAESEVFQSLDFEEIEQSYSSFEYSYIVGKIGLSQLLKQQDAINAGPIFIASFPLE